MKIKMWLQEKITVNNILWPMLVVAAIIYAAGPTGVWLNQQFTDLPSYWGWFGSALLGVATFGGVKLTTSRVPWYYRLVGVGVVMVGGLVTIMVDQQYFSAKHEFVMSLALGVVGTVLAVLAGIVEGIHLGVQEAKQDTRTALQQELELERIRQQHQIELENMRKSAELERWKERQEVKSKLPVQRVQSSVQNKMNTEQPCLNHNTTKEQVEHAIKARGEDWTFREIASELDKSVGTVHGCYRELLNDGRISPNGHGK
jgi:hypothetical protein